MNRAQALHASARRYCDKHFSAWAARYAKLPNDGREADGYHYTKEALDMFPRYLVLDAIRVELDRIDPDSLADLQSTRARLLEAATRAQDDSTRNLDGSIEAAAMSQEREAFCSYVRGLRDADLVNVRPIPYNRVLTSSETADIWKLLRDRWKMQRGHYFYPRGPRSVADLEAFEWEDFQDFCSSFDLREVLASHGVTRVWELTGHHPEYVRDVSAFDPASQGGETYWSSDDLDWILYVSEEDSVTVGGWLLDEIKAAWPEWKERAMPDEWKEPLPFVLIGSLLTNEFGTWLGNLVVLLLMAAVGSVLLYDLYAGAWLSPGVLRAFVAWCIFTVFYSKLINVFTSGGPFASGVFGLCWIAALEAVLHYWEKSAN